MKAWDQIKVAFEAKYHFPEIWLESVSKMHEMVMIPREIIHEYDKILKTTQRWLQEPMIEKKKVEWFTSRLWLEFKRVMEKIYSTYIEDLQVVVEIESQQWWVNTVNDDLSNKIMKLIK